MFHSLQVSAQLKALSKSKCFMLATAGTRLAFNSVVEQVEKYIAGEELSFASKSGDLLSTFLARAHFWCVAETNAGSKVYGEKAAVSKWNKIKVKEPCTLQPHCHHNHYHCRHHHNHHPTTGRNIVQHVYLEKKGIS